MAERDFIRSSLILNSVKLMILLVGMAILLHGFTSSLPYHLDPDEPIIRIRADTLASTGSFYDFYSPLGPDLARCTAETPTNHYASGPTFAGDILRLWAGWLGFLRG